MAIPQTRRYQFLRGKNAEKIKDYFVEQFKNKFLPFIEAKFERIKAF